jgi:hypothetical protein
MDSHSGSFLAQAYLDLRSGNLSPSSVWTTTVLAVVVAVSLLNYLLTPRLDPREPPTVKPTIPWIGHILGVIRHQADYNRIIQSVSYPRISIAITKQSLQQCEP